MQDALKQGLKLEDYKGEKLGSRFIREQDPLRTWIEMPDLQSSKFCTNFLTAFYFYT